MAFADGSQAPLRLSVARLNHSGPAFPHDDYRARATDREDFPTAIAPWYTPWCVPWCNRRWEVFTVGGPRSIVIVRKSGSAVIESGNTQPQRRLRSVGECHSAGLGSFGFCFYCIQMGICLVCARFLSITFQR